MRLIVVGGFVCMQAGRVHVKLRDAQLRVVIQPVVNVWAQREQRRHARHH